MPALRRFRVTIALAIGLALPALVAVAQEGDGPDLPDEAAAEATEATTASDHDTSEDGDDETDEADEADREDTDELEADDTEGDEAQDAHGVAVSAAAECLPSGKELHGTGLTKGVLMRAVAHGSEVEVDGLMFTVTDAATAADLCDAVATFAASVEAPETAKGRPDHAGGPDGEPGPPEHAGRPDHAGPPSSEG